MSAARYVHVHMNGALAFANLWLLHAILLWCTTDFYFGKTVIDIAETPTIIKYVAMQESSIL
jgi:hypothetical protein